MMGNNLNGLKRVMKETVKHYKLQSCIVLILIFVSAIANVYGSVFLQTLIDDYITPLTLMSTPDYGPLLGAIGFLACIYGIGILSTYTWNRLMINISLGTLNDTRESLFKHMETLPIAYFDTHAHGDIMSVYTNDTDTLRQLISQSLPQMISSFFHDDLCIDFNVDLKCPIDNDHNCYGNCDDPGQPVHYESFWPLFPRTAGNIR